MQKRIHKYYLKVFSIILLISFLNINMGLCGLVIINCESEETSCCCKHHDNSDSARLNLEKKCCCEVKEMTRQPADINLTLTESFQKNPLPVSYIYSDREIVNSDFILSYTAVLSFHSPPGEKIHIVNSNFRI